MRNYSAKHMYTHAYTHTKICSFWSGACWSNPDESKSKQFLSTSPKVFDVPVGGLQACSHQRESTASVSIFQMKTREKWNGFPTPTNCNSQVQICDFNLLSCWSHRKYHVTWLCSRSDVTKKKKKNTMETCIYSKLVNKWSQKKWWLRKT